MKTRGVISVAVALGVIAAPAFGWAQAPAPLKNSRVVDLTLPIESSTAGIPGLKIYADNPSRVDVIATMSDAQRDQLRAEGRTLGETVEINGRVMISLLSMMTHNGTHIDAPRHVLEKGSPVDQIPLARVAREGVPIDMTHKGANASISAKDILDTGVELGGSIGSQDAHYFMPLGLPHPEMLF